MSDCGALFRELFESDPPAWHEERHEPFRLEVAGFRPVCGYGTSNGRHECPGE